jgi:hypothetical protein
MKCCAGIQDAKLTTHKRADNMTHIRINAADKHAKMILTEHS